MMAESAEHVTSFVLNHMKIADMRAKEDFKPLDLVRVTGSHITGKILKFDADKRLVYVSSTIGDRWWYVKDLELEKSSSSSRKEREVHAKGAKKIIDEKQGVWILFDDPLFSDRAIRELPLQVG